MASNEPVVFVSGGAGNLGRAVVGAFLEAGWRVAVALHHTDRKGALDPLAAAHPGRLHSFLIDLTKEMGAESAVRQTAQWGGRIDAAAHLVGAWAGGAKTAEAAVGTWDVMMEINLRSAFLLARAAIPRMLEGGGGSLVFVSSRSAVTGRSGMGAYAVAKAGLIVLAETIAEEYRQQGIRANCVLPGTIDTPANRASIPDADHERWTPPEEIARAIVFLASPASAAVNGAAIPVYGRS
jgi:NAD(P)-dependent dehydrogenase (short-subunit alcohol dehydrogenase family)